MKKIKCDTCGKLVNEVRRVAIRKNYDRLFSKNQIYNCEECYQIKKEKDEKNNM